MLESSKIPKDSSLSRREIRRDKRRTRIRDAAFELFERQGFEATTIDQIAALADVGKGTFFNYFPTKQNVLTDYYARLSAEFINNAENIKTGNAQKRFAKLFHSIETTLRREGQMVDALYPEVFKQPKLIALDGNIEERVSVLYAGWLEADKGKKKLRDDFDTALAVRLIFDIWSATLRNWIEADKSFSLAEELNRKFELLFTGLQAKNF
ncbi:MAG: TetR/AcrR family transcriptional regulator [Pyrinomonadaceae bacterium]